ncbi:pirin family protein [Flavihumibacter stibioxidans]|uniref:Pirin family protein n=1 Tax=Flavihumibacter stibioxidans TaxID=1834163 RepID=A0ABR7MBE9_9BACT|nr:pirin family protein [Flavihumibacter stibioxidans]MBC6491829.1 hypothetical protein [Flavihumibacter stibioxidans]
MKKGILHILSGRSKQITPEESVLQPLPHKDFRFANPIIVIHHIGPLKINAGAASRIHPHPHRGFAPVTFLLQGEAYHRDSMGNEGFMKAGDVQWMFAGKGILHSEGPTKELLAGGGDYELIQIWVNVPARHKWDDPYYKQAGREEMPLVSEEPGVDLRLASGEYEGLKGPLESFTPVVSIVGSVAKGSRYQFTAKAGYWTLLYVASGSIAVDQELIGPQQLVVFEKGNEEIQISASEDARLLYLSAKPIEEPIAAKDNFVMNTEAEVNQAMEDYQKGLFGELLF